MNEGDSMKLSLRTFATYTAATVLGYSSLVAQAVTLPGPVVDTQWLAAHLNDVQVIEVRGNPKSFTTDPVIETDAKGKKTLDEIGGHIPGSRLIESKKIRVDRKIGDLTVKYMIPERADFEKFVQAAGIDKDKPLVIVPVGMQSHDVNDALRLYWQFKVYGEDQMAVLDGGMAAWLLEGKPYAKDATANKTGNWSSKSDRTAQYSADSQDVEKIIQQKNATLVDAREAPQYHGLMKRDYVYAYGHLEGAKNLSPDTTFKQTGGAVRLLSPNTYKAVLSAQGIDPNAPTVVYCNSGAQSGLPWFIMSEVLGNKNVRQYDGSLHQWTLEKRPLVGAVPLN
jgi:thiosulfate/3-mercaptopyruvate sulfurtransferase